MNASEKILFVDDEPLLLTGIRRQLWNRYVVETAASPRIALDALVSAGPFAVVVSDMQMPGNMDGARFLAEVKKNTPRSVRLMLTGQADVSSAISAVNQGHIFRFLTKPCDTETLILAIEGALQQYRLQEAESELLERTLEGAAKLLFDAIGTLNPDLFNSTSGIRRYAEGVATALALAERWRVRLAATVAQIGYVAVPTEVIQKYAAGETLDESEEAAFRTHPEVAQRLLQNIPRLEGVAEMVARQLNSVPPELVGDAPYTWDPIDAGAMVLQAAMQFDHDLQLGVTVEDALARLRNECNTPETIVTALAEVHRQGTALVSRKVDILQLASGMMLDQDVVANNGQCLVARGHEVTETMKARLWNFRQGVGIAEPIDVLVAPSD